MESSGELIYLVDNTGIRIDRLSKAAQAVWMSKIHSILEIKVLAMVGWGEKDSTEKSFADLCKCERWEVPICELVSE
jgi:inorganic triphosphatase YgiF